jgi:hypothetical protein
VAKSIWFLNDFWSKTEKGGGSDEEVSELVRGLLGTGAVIPFLDKFEWESGGE